MTSAVPHKPFICCHPSITTRALSRVNFDVGAWGFFRAPFRSIGNRPLCIRPRLALFLNQRWQPFDSTNHLFDPAGRDHDSCLRSPRLLREAGCPLTRPVLTSYQGMTRAALRASDGVRLLRFPYPKQPHRQFACHHDLADARMFPVLQPLIGTLQLWDITRRALSRFHQQTAQHGIALLADPAQLLPPSTGILRWIQPQVTDHLATPREALDSAQRQRKRQRRDRTDSGMRLQQPRYRIAI